MSRAGSGGRYHVSVVGKLQWEKGLHFFTNRASREVFDKWEAYNFRQKSALCMENIRTKGSARKSDVQGYGGRQTGTVDHLEGAVFLLHMTYYYIYILSDEPLKIRARFHGTTI